MRTWYYVLSSGNRIVSRVESGLYCSMDIVQVDLGTILNNVPTEKQFFNNFNLNFLMHNMQILPLKLYFVHSKIPKTPRGETPEIKVNVLTWTTNKPHFVNLKKLNFPFSKEGQNNCLITKASTQDLILI